MGAADVVPGVSGGTMAFILGIYEELIEATSRITDPEFLRPLSRLQIAQALNALPWAFLVAVFGGVLLAVFSLAPGLEWLLEDHPVLLWAFFFGLVLASIFTVSRRIASWTAPKILAAVGGAIGAYIFVGLVPIQTSEALWFIFVSGVIAISAMVLPGISGSFMLVLLGKYQYILGAVTNRDFVVLAVFGLGTGIGILAFARFLRWLLARYHDLTVAVLIGLMAGSLRKVWPWKEVLETTLDRHGKTVPLVEQNILPLLGTEVAIAAGLAIVGLGSVLLLERLANRSQH